MNEKRYRLQYLPLFESDLNGIIDYINDRLMNPAAAEVFLYEVQEAIHNRSACAESFEPYHSAKERQHPYYRIYVKSYVIYYVVIGNVMEVRRIVYNRRNREELV